MNNFSSNKIKIVIILIGLVTFSIYYFYPKDDYVMEMVKPINPVVEKIEKIEDIEILRFIENGYKVQYIEVDSDTVAVDTPNDLERVREIVANRLNNKK